MADNVPHTEPMLWTVRQTAAALAVCPKTLYTLTRAGQLRAVRVGRAVRYDVADVRRFIETAKEVTP